MGAEKINGGIVGRDDVDVGFGVEGCEEASEGRLLGDEDGDAEREVGMKMEPGAERVCG